MLLETERLLLRPYSIQNAAALYQLNNDTEVMKYTGDVGYASIADAEKYIKDYLLNPLGQLLKYNMGRLAVLDKDTGEFLGFCGIKTHETSQITDIGYRFMREHWGKGYATEASEKVLEFGFEHHQKEQIIAHVHEHNYGSQRVAEKLGFHLDHRFLWDGLLPGRYYKLTRDAYYHQRN
ncbi:GNAT family N-acetyltransferase [Nonlabens marinus]|uniref:Acetyltransferase, GNAT family n=1 Tax=Nonlabens marinus S1-08 TaxID=1454201 RepID=W8VV78_9FLAO|nr:GNAT family N-acetyltransferase [Nonlabens marinus]BAO55183.1 acetyltransferase, GNAT family [Nonlabens marinus S1-08]